MGKDDGVLARERAELVGVSHKRHARGRGKLLRHGNVKTLRRVEAGTHGRSSQRQAIQPRKRGLQLLGRTLQKAAPARDLLRKGDGHRVLQVGATALDHVSVLHLQAAEGGLELRHRREQALAHRRHGRNMHGRGEGIV